MAATKIGVVYGTKNKHIRRIIVPDDDAELNNPLHVGPGETLATVPVGTSIDHATLAKLLGTNADPSACRCAVINNGTNKVIDIVMADPLIDNIEGHTMMFHSDAAIGWNYNAITKTLISNQIANTISIANTVSKI
jgi:hypothetical protein